MATAFKCDSCGDYYDGGGNEYQLKYGTRKLFDLELCSDCSSKLEEDITKYDNE